MRVWTNVAEVHLEFFASVEAIADAKAEMLEGATADTVLVANADDPLVMARAPRFAGRVVTFGTSDGASVGAWPSRASVSTAWRRRSDGRWRATVQVPLLGRANLQNVLAAVAVAEHFGVPLDAIAERARTLRAASHRGDVRGSSEAWWSWTTPTTRTRGRCRPRWACSPASGGSSGGWRCWARCSNWAPTDALHEACGRAAAGSGLSLLITVGGAPARALGRAALAAGMPESSVAHAAHERRGRRLAAGLVRPNDLVLVKGSRGITTEVVVDRLGPVFQA